jgi:hypothetical protein
VVGGSRDKDKKFFHDGLEDYVLLFIEKIFGPLDAPATGGYAGAPMAEAMGASGGVGVEACLNRLVRLRSGLTSRNTSPT